jgi:DASH complex subunit ASK1
MYASAHAPWCPLILCSFAQFWVSFFEKAANIRVPTYHDDTLQEPDHEDLSAEEEQPGEDASVSQISPEDSIVSSEGSSFMPAQAAVSSTPARSHGVEQSMSDDSEEVPSWASSLESPIVRLSREINALSYDPGTEEADTTAREDLSAADTTAMPDLSQVEKSSTRDKGKGRAKEGPDLLRNVLRNNLYSATPKSTRKVDGSTRDLKMQNPYLGLGTKPSQWDGIVDLASPERNRRIETADSSRLPSASKIPLAAPRIKANAPKLGRTPKKDAANRITQDVLRGVNNKNPHMRKPGSETNSSILSPPSLTRYTKPGYVRGAGRAQTSTSDISTPPSITRWTGKYDMSTGLPEDVDSPIPAPPDISRYLGGKPLPSLGGMESSQEISAPPSVTRYTEPADDDTIQSAISDAPDLTRYTIAPSARPSLATDQREMDSLVSDASLNSMMRRVGLDFRLSEGGAEPDPNISLGSSDDSFDDNEIADAAPAAFQYAMQQGGRRDSFDDSFGSNESVDSSLDEDVGQGVAQPYVSGGEAMDDDFSDDSFDAEHDQEEETIFGRPPAQRYASQARSSNGNGQLRLHGEALLEDTLGIGSQLARQGRVEESPTPWGANVPRPV